MLAEDGNKVLCPFILNRLTSLRLSLLLIFFMPLVQRLVEINRNFIQPELLAPLYTRQSHLKSMPMLVIMHCSGKADLLPTKYGKQENPSGKRMFFDRFDLLF
jgi:hypothetical protein